MIGFLRRAHAPRPLTMGFAHTQHPHALRACPDLADIGGMDFLKLFAQYGNQANKKKENHA